MKKEFRSFKDARKFVQNLGLKSQSEYRKWWKENRPKDLPSNAPREYKNKGWTSWGDFLDSGFVAPSLRQFKSFDESRTYVRTLKLLGKEEYSKWAHSPKRPLDIPSSPSKTYQKKWIGWGDWLGTGTIAPQTIHKNYLPFKEAKDIARELAKKYNLKTFGDWEIAVKEGKIPKNIPLFPQRIYSKKRKK